MQAAGAETAVVPWAGVASQPTASRLSEHVLVLARLLTLGLIGAFATVAGYLGLISMSDFRPWWLVAVVVAATFSWLQLVAPAKWSTPLALVEAAVALTVVAAAGTAAWPLLVYLIMSPVFVGIAVGGWLPVLVTGAQVATFAALQLLGQTSWSEVPATVLVQLAFAGLAFGVATAVVRLLVERAWGKRGAYAQALTLLEQLSELSRQLPSGLGMEAALAGTSHTFQERLGAQEVAIFRSHGGDWVRVSGPEESSAIESALGSGLPGGLSAPGKDVVDAAAGIDRHSPWADRARVRLLPLRTSGSTRAIAALLFPDRAPHTSAVVVRELAEEAAARLGAADVYGQVRERATAEERRRVSREIHDGVAQDLAALTYTLDNIADTSGLEPVSVAASEVRRLVRELRFSIFALRTDMGADQTLGAAIGDYAQQVSGSTGLVVHTTISDTASRGDAHLQHELLRICQEAVANARRHSQAHNLWITYRSSPTRRLLRVADDGVGAFGPRGPRGAGGEGLAIMRERVLRIGGSLAVRRRLGGGTVVEVIVNGPGTGTQNADDERTQPATGDHVAA